MPYTCTFSVNLQEAWFSKTRLDDQISDSGLGQRCEGDVPKNDSDYKVNEYLPEKIINMASCRFGANGRSGAGVDVSSYILNTCGET